MTCGLLARCARDQGCLLSETNLTASFAGNHAEPVLVAAIARRRGLPNSGTWTVKGTKPRNLPFLADPDCTHARQITDVCVPISRLAEFVSRSDVLVEQSGLVAPIVAHIGDGNVHRAILWKGAPGETEPPRAVEKLAKQLVELAQELEGTCAGEHGIGCGFLRRTLLYRSALTHCSQLDQAQVPASRARRRDFGPDADRQARTRSAEPVEPGQGPLRRRRECVDFSHPHSLLYGVLFIKDVLQEKLIMCSRSGESESGTRRAPPRSPCTAPPNSWQLQRGQRLPTADGTGPDWRHCDPTRCPRTPAHATGDQLERETDDRRPPPETTAHRASYEADIDQRAVQRTLEW